MLAAQVASVDPAPADKEYDELLYKDGDRVRGHLLRREGNLMIFQSVRFGELRVSVVEATVHLAHPPVIAKTTPAVIKPPAEGPEDEASAHRQPWEYLYPTALREQLREIFGPWKGRFSFASQFISDSSDRRTVATEAKLSRKWAHDDVQLNLRYDYAETNNVATSDLAKFAASWRHDLKKRYFSIYNPAAEWDRDSTYNGVAVDYLLLHQEVGAGVSLLTGKKQQLRVGLSENRFDVWLTNQDNRHSDANVESLFAEMEWQLPWRISITERGVYYYSIANGRDGWENRFHIDKKLTETLSIGVLHEVRYNHPDERVADYNKLKFMLGLDF